MAINFPNNPVNNATYTFNRVTYIFRKPNSNEGYWAVTTPATASVATPTDIDKGTDNAKYVTPLALHGSGFVRQDDTTKETTLKADGVERLRTHSTGVSLIGDLTINGVSLADLIKNTKIT